MLLDSSRMLLKWDFHKKVTHRTATYCTEQSATQRNATQRTAIYCIATQDQFPEVRNVPCGTVPQCNARNRNKFHLLAQWLGLLQTLRCGIVTQCFLINGKLLAVHCRFFPQHFLETEFCLQYIALRCGTEFSRKDFVKRENVALPTLRCVTFLWKSRFILH